MNRTVHTLRRAFRELRAEQQLADHQRRAAHLQAELDRLNLPDGTRAPDARPLAFLAPDGKWTTTSPERPHHLKPWQYPYQD